MPDLAALARDTERFLDQPPFEAMIAAGRRARRRGVLRASGVAVAALLAVVFVVAGLGRLGGASGSAGPLSVLPEWTAGEIVEHPDAFVVRQLSSRTYPPRVLRVWKRCALPAEDHDCFGREAIEVTDDDGHRLMTLGAVTGSSEQPDLGDDGLLREVGDGVWYWAHRDPGPYLVSATMERPAELTFGDRPASRTFGVPTIECPDRVGVCTLDTAARTVGRLARPDVPDTRWATPTPAGCGLWALAGTGGNLRLVIQQRDGSFATADIPDDGVAATMAEGGADCEVAYYQAVAGDRYQLDVSLDQGRTWTIRQATALEVAGLVEKQPRPRTLIPPQWQSLPGARAALDPPGTLQPLGCVVRTGCAGSARSAGR